MIFYSILFYLIYSYFILLFPIISYHILLYPTISYYILLHPVTSCYLLLTPESYYIRLYPITVYPVIISIIIIIIVIVRGYIWLLMYAKKRAGCSSKFIKLIPTKNPPCSANCWTEWFFCQFLQRSSGIWTPEGVQISCRQRVRHILRDNFDVNDLQMASVWTWLQLETSCGFWNPDKSIPIVTRKPLVY